MDLEELQASEDEHFDTNEPPSKKSKKGGKKMKQPTVEELNELNETVALFKNNLFRLQITELLKAVRIHDKTKNILNNWLETFEDFLKNLPIEDTYVQYVSQKPYMKNVIKQCENLQCDKDITFTFRRPEFMHMFGLYKIDSLPGPNITIDIYLNMPKACFLEKDFLNNRYFVKKFFFLMYIAEQLKLSKKYSSINCSYYNDNLLTPYLILKPNSTDRISVNIFAVPEQEYFKPQRFLPDVNNVRAPVFANLPIDIDNFKHVPTCFYNASLCFDVTLSENNEFIQEILNNLNNVKEGLKLIVIWMNQRQFNVGLGAFSNDIIVYIIIYLIQKRHINNHMSSYQVFRNFLNFMNITDLTQTPISLCENISDDILKKFKRSFDVVIMDKTGFYNVASFVDVDVYLKMRHECQLAFNTLDKSTSSSFQELLLFKVPQFLQYDGIIDIRCPNNFKSLLENSTDEEKVTYLGAHNLLIVKRLQSVLKKGLNKRVFSIVPLSLNQTTWEYGIPSKMNTQRIMFGIRLDPVTAFQIVEFGPNLNEPGEKEFKDFWGKLTSNRRFQDGTAKVVVCFEAKTIKNKRGIIKTIVNFLVKEKLNLDHKFYYDEFEDVLENDKVGVWYPQGTNEETTIAVIRSSDELGKKIRTLDVQLGITGIVGISDIFCYTNVFPPIPTQHKCGKIITKEQNQNIILNEKLKTSPKYVQTIECSIQLEHSSKWPGDLEALRAMKTMFYLEMSKLLDKKHNIRSSVKESHIDILYEGIVFRYMFYLSKEVALLKREVKEDGMLCSKDTEESVEIEKKFIVVPKVIGALKGILSVYPCYGLSTCLAKRWIRAQLIDDYHLPDIVIDLLNSYQFLNHSLYAPAVSPQIAFLRFLKYIIEAQWDLEPVVLNFNEELTKEDISKVDTKLHSSRDNYPALFILTPYDNGESIFTRKAPSKQILTRLKSLAFESLKIIETSTLSESFIDIKSLFIPNTDGYDCIIHLKKLPHPRKHEQIITNGVKKIVFRKPCEDKLIPVVNFDPIAIYLKELRKTYGAFCLFFHDTYGGGYIGVLWKPNVTIPKDLKLSNMLGRTIENDTLVLSKKEIMTGFEVIGNGIFNSIDVRT